MPSFLQRIGSAIGAFSAAPAAPLAPAKQRRIPLAQPQFHLRDLPRVEKRSYAGAIVDRLTEDFLGPLTTGDAEMRTRIRLIRNRARELERNEPYSRHYLSRLEDNIYDHHGMAFSSLAGEWRSKDGKTVFNLDPNDCLAIEQAYTEWKKNPFVTGDMTANEGGRLALRSTARDGDVFVRWVIDPSVNKFGFALQLIEADLCDDLRNELRKDNQNRVQAQVRMGVEVNNWMRPIGYWMLKEYPGDQQWWNAQGYWSERHPASEYLHPFHRTRITQVRDVTWLCAIMRDLNMLNGYDEAAIVAARTGAAKMGFITRDYDQAGAPYTGEQGYDAAEGGDKAMDAEPGLIEDLSQSPGLKFEKWDPAYPHDQYDSFIKTRLRRIGAGLDTSYYAIANDLSDVNFSSIRSGVLEDRERFKSLQSWWCGDYESPIFLKFLEIGLLNGTIKELITGRPLPFAKKEKFQNHKFRPRRWPWVDPQKDAAADILAINNRLASRSQKIEEHCDSTFEEVIREQAAEQEYAESQGVTLPSDPAAAGADGDGDGDEGGDKKPKPADKK